MLKRILEWCGIRRKRRVDVAALVRFFESHPELQPARNVYYVKLSDAEAVCCGLVGELIRVGAYTQEEISKLDQKDMIKVFEEGLGVSRSYLVGFIAGFDDQPCTTGDYAGLNDGRELAHQLIWKRGR